MTVMRFALGGSVRENEDTFCDPSLMDPPHMLISYAYIGGLTDRLIDSAADVMLDSGAFTAHSLGKTVDLQAFIDAAKKLIAKTTKLAEVAALDVIGDWRAGLKNCETMWEQGVPALPCYHYGEPRHVLEHIAKTYPKIALGGCAGFHASIKTKWAKACISHVWPKPVHGFGFACDRSMLAVPFHSADASSWATRSCRYGMVQSLGQQGNFKKRKRQLGPEVNFYLKRARLYVHRWRKALAECEEDAVRYRQAIKEARAKLCSG